jgi:hypothetical protein
MVAGPPKPFEAHSMALCALDLELEPYDLQFALLGKLILWSDSSLLFFYSSLLELEYLLCLNMCNF